MTTTTPAPAVHYDPYDVDIDGDPYPTWHRLRDEAPLYRNDELDFYALSRWDDVKPALLDRDTHRSGRGTVLEVIRAGVEIPPATRWSPTPAWSPAPATRPPPGSSASRCSCSPSTPTSAACSSRTRRWCRAPSRRSSAWRHPRRCRPATCGTMSRWGEPWCRRARRCCCSTGRPTGTSATSAGPTTSTSTATRGPTSRSATGSTSASARRWPGWRAGWRWRILRRWPAWDVDTDRGRMAHTASVRGWGSLPVLALGKEAS